MIRAVVPQGALAARLGGDEFVILLNQASAAQIVDLGSRLREQFQQLAAQTFSTPVPVTLSIGADLFDQPPLTFSWWDYRQLAFPKNHGLRIDHVLLSAPLAARCTGCRIDRSARKGEKPSDHAPVVVEIDR